MSADRIPLISMGLYRTVSHVLGPECIVKVRREGFDIFDVFQNCSDLSSLFKIVSSGSRTEGFDFKSSDLDVMYVQKHSVVYPSHRPQPEGYPPQTTVLTYETDYSSPGFVLIKCLCLNESIWDKSISNSLVSNSIGRFVSSKLFLEYYKDINPDSFKPHGPCVTLKHAFGEYDFAHCLKCSDWPQEATYFITRSLKTGWPNQQIVNDICRDGCLFVPVSSKRPRCQDTADMEWRMSFSLAEKKLICNMNHCQFLCYGLLKIILNEVLKKDETIEDLLCSYFLKTAVFWEISEDTSGWSIQNFLCKFWKTFCRLLKWVDVGYCPNFFNPMNNMIAGKIYGHKQTQLMKVLRSLHNEGMPFLLKCPPLQEKLSMILRQPDLVLLLPMDEKLYVPQWCIEYTEVLRVLSAHNLADRDFMTCYNELCNLIRVNPSSRVMKAALAFRGKMLLHRMGEDILGKVARTDKGFISNRAVVNFCHMALLFLFKNPTSFCGNEIIAAKWFYIFGMHHQTINLLSNVKARLLDPNFIYRWTVDEAKYKRLRRPDSSLESFLKSRVVDYVYITDKTTIHELKLELLADARATEAPIITIPPMVFINFLLLLSYHHLDDKIRRNDILRDLQALVLYDDGYHLDFQDQAISLEILGICHQLCENYQCSYQAYSYAMDDIWNSFKLATYIRIRSLTSEH